METLSYPLSLSKLRLALKSNTKKAQSYCCLNKAHTKQSYTAQSSNTTYNSRTMGEGSAIGEGGDGSSVPADGGLSMAMSMDLFVSDSASNDDPSDAETSAHKTREELVNMKEEVFQKHRAGYTPVVHDIVIKTAKEFTSSSSSPGGEYQNAEQALNEIEKAYYGRDSTKAAELTKTLLEKRKDIRLRKSDHSEVNYLQKKLDSK